ncbi:DUF7147 family protein [Bacillus sp. DJP31]|uniref:DUF7147 family protein n=1 Tax=Bacillus sp. DJP31 TaxID=3409789 RepID=UPI003BB5398F
MIQRFIELGEGYSDIYELVEIAKTNSHRVKYFLALHTKINDKKVASIAVVLNPAKTGKFQPIYICREGISLSEEKPSQRLAIFEYASEEVKKPIIRFEIKPSSAFSEKELYYQYVIGILRLYHVIPPLS